jgi:hypothetical protein
MVPTMVVPFSGWIDAKRRPMILFMKAFSVAAVLVLLTLVLQHPSEITVAGLF